LSRVRGVSRKRAPCAGRSGTITLWQNRIRVQILLGPKQLLHMLMQHLSQGYATCCAEHTAAGVCITDTISRSPEACARFIACLTGRFEAPTDIEASPSHQHTCILHQPVPWPPAPCTVCLPRLHAPALLPSLPLGQTHHMPLWNPMQRAQGSTRCRHELHAEQQRPVSRHGMQARGTPAWHSCAVPGVHGVSASILCQLLANTQLVLLNDSRLC
jgi:hypothetical protein